MSKRKFKVADKVWVRGDSVMQWRPEDKNKRYKAIVNRRAGGPTYRYRVDILNDDGSFAGYNSGRVGAWFESEQLTRRVPAKKFKPGTKVAFTGYDSEGTRNTHGWYTLKEHFNDGFWYATFADDNRQVMIHISGCKRKNWK